MNYTNAQLHTLQDRYIQTNDWAYYLALKYLAEVQIKNAIEKSGVFMLWDDITIKAEDAALRLLEQYKKPGYRIQFSIFDRLLFDVKHVLYGTKTKKLDLEVELVHTVCIPAHEMTQDPILALDNLDLFHLAKCQHYSQAVKAIAQTKGKAYCYQRAHELRYVFLMLRKGIETNAKRKNLRNNRPRNNGRTARTSQG